MAIVTSVSSVARRQAALASEQRAQRDARRSAPARRAARSRCPARATGPSGSAAASAPRAHLRDAARRAADELTRRALDLAQHVVLVLTRHRREAGCLTEPRLGASAPPDARLHLDRARRVDPATGDDEGLPQRDRERPRAQMLDAKLAAVQSVHATLSYGSSSVVVQGLGLGVGGFCGPLSPESCRPRRVALSSRRARRAIRGDPGFLLEVADWVAMMAMVLRRSNEHASLWRGGDGDCDREGPRRWRDSALGSGARRERAFARCVARGWEVRVAPRRV